MNKLVKDDIQVDINTDIFKYLDPLDNISLYDLSNGDKIYMLYTLKQYYLELRKKIGVDSNITFGLEIEFEESYRNIIEKEIEKYDNWSVVDDRSLSNGGEVLSPKLIDNEKSWADLSNICNIVDKNAYVMDNTGGHIHIGMHILGNNPKYWANFTKLWMAYENVIFRFLYGEYVSFRSKILENARPISLNLINDLDRINDRSKLRSSSHLFMLLDAGDGYQERRKRAVNFTNVSSIEPYKYNLIENKNTIEFRSPNGTFNPVVWQNNVNLLVHLLMYAKSDKFDEDIVNKRILQLINDDIPSNLYKYSRIYNDQAIELADMIFDNNLDKIYFLRQYIKDGMVSTKPLVKSRPFTIK